MNGCQYDTCSDVTCAPGPCQTATCDGDVCVRGSRCAEGETCCADACVPAGCDDSVPCTVDTCGASGCEHAPDDGLCDDGESCTDDVCTATGCEASPRSGACDDGVFCNGPDTCLGGACAEHAGDPCAGESMCDEEARTCEGCASDADCPNEITGPWGGCEGFAGACGQSGTRTRTVTSYTCAASICVAAERTESEPCTRDTDGDSCGSETCGSWGDAPTSAGPATRAGSRAAPAPGGCVRAGAAPTIRAPRTGAARGTPTDELRLDELRELGRLRLRGHLRRERLPEPHLHGPVCAAGSCGDAMRTETESCSRDTDGTSCGMTSCESWGACDYSTLCDESASQSRTCTDRVCAAGSCGDAMRSENRTCTRDTDGLSCGGGVGCMQRECVVGSCRDVDTCPSGRYCCVEFCFPDGDPCIPR